MRVWLDTDLGSDVDDALALAYLMRHPALELVGVSTVFGDVALRSRLVRKLLALGGADATPVVTGLGKPLTGKRRGVMFGHEGIGLLDDPAPILRVDADPDGGERIRELADALGATTPDVIVSIGPMTNLGALARESVPLPRLAIMGGKIDDVMLPGMSEAIPEWNWWCDPVAVQHVLACDAAEPPTVVPAEVTFRTPLAPEDLDRLDCGEPLCEALHRLSHEWLRAQRERLGILKPAVLLHDPLTAATLAKPELCEYATRRLQVDDEARSQVGQGPMVRVATDVDLAATRAHLLDVWTAAR